MHHLDRRFAARAAAVLLFAGAATAVACSDTTSPEGNGTVLVRLTDAPLDSVAEVNVFVVRIDAKAAATDSADAAENADAPERGGWITIAEPERSFNLLALRTDTATVGAAELPEGDYRSLRLVIDPLQSNIVLKDGTVLDGRTTGGKEPGIKFPSAATSGIKVQLDRTVAVGDDTTEVTVDFDAAQSFHLAGNAVKGGFVFRPVIRATTRTR